MSKSNTEYIGGFMCLMGLVALIVPRMLLFFIWLLTDWFSKAFEGWLWPLLGFIFMPYTTLVYMWAMMANNHHVSGYYVLFLILAIIIDLGSIFTKKD